MQMPARSCRVAQRSTRGIGLVLSVLALALGGAGFGPPPAVQVQAQVDALAAEIAQTWNTSIGFAMGYTDPSTGQPRVISTAAGPDSIFARGGTRVSAASRYPAGSVAKTFTAVAALRQAEQGRLDLDAPVHALVDPWLAGQSPPVPPLVDLWGGDERINTVTSRQLLAMRSGVVDYDDTTVFNWTIDNPGRDFLPLDYVRLVAGGGGGFAFDPGEGGLYSGVGYILMGWVLCAVSGAATWDQLDQAALWQGPPATSPTLLHTAFLGRGTCGSHAHVVHQYIYRNQSYDAWMAPSDEPPSLALSDFGDLYGTSCANGWAMGNIATSAGDLASFWHALGTGGILAAPSLRQMQRFEPLTQGEMPAPGTPYGMGVMLQQTLVPLNGPAPAESGGGWRCRPPLCVCTDAGHAAPATPASAASRAAGGRRGRQRCALNLTQHIHGGMDWGSGAPQASFLPQYNASYVITHNSYIGMNTSRSFGWNRAWYHKLPAVGCQLMNIAFALVQPGFPGFNSSACVWS